MEYTNDPAVQFTQQPVEVAVEPVHEPVQYTQQVGAEPANSLSTVEYTVPGWPPANDAAAGAMPGTVAAVPMPEGGMLPYGQIPSADGVQMLPMPRGEDKGKRVRPPGLKVPRWTPEEEEKLKSLVAVHGTRNWKEIAAGLAAGRTATAVEQHYNILIGKRKKNYGPSAHSDVMLPPLETTIEGLEGLDEATKAIRMAEAVQRAAQRAQEKMERDNNKAEREQAKAEKAEQKAAALAASEASKLAKAQRAAEKAEKARMPKKPWTSYLFYAEETRPALKAEHPDLPAFEIVKLQAEGWKSLTEEEKVKYVDAMKRDNERYEREMLEGGWPMPTPGGKAAAAMARISELAAKREAAEAGEGPDLTEEEAMELFALQQPKPKKERAPKRPRTSSIGSADGAMPGDYVPGSTPDSTQPKPKRPKRDKQPAAPPVEEIPQYQLPAAPIPWFVPEGFTVQEEPPTSEMLTFDNDAGDALLGRHIMYCWDGVSARPHAQHAHSTRTQKPNALAPLIFSLCFSRHNTQVGWVEGVIEERNTNPRFKLDGDFVNFWVYYQLDNNCSKHVLETDMYAWGPEAEADSWVLLTEVPAAEMVSGVAAVAAVVGEPAPMVAPID